MPEIRVAAAAAEDLRELILTHELPPDTSQRVAGRLRPLRRFPQLGPALGGRWAGTRYVLGPWAWLVIVYEYDADADVVTVLTTRAGRTRPRAASLHRDVDLVRGARRRVVGSRKTAHPRRRRRAVPVTVTLSRRARMRTDLVLTATVLLSR